MDALFAKADAIRPVAKKRRLDRAKGSKPGPSKSTDKVTDKTASSITKSTSLPRSLRASDPPPESTRTYKHIQNKKLRNELTRQSAHAARSRELLKDAELLLQDEAGGIQVEDEMERTWRLSQAEISSGAGEESSKGRREWMLDAGPYQCRYTRNGRSVSVLRDDHGI
jgi:U3 small nucleolar RNA-associated protein 7